MKIKELKNKKFTKVSRQIAIVLVVSLVLVAGMLLVTGSLMDSRQYRQFYGEKSLEIAGTAAELVDGDYVDKLCKLIDTDEFKEARAIADEEDSTKPIEDLLAQKGMLADFKTLAKLLQEIRLNMNVEFLYIQRINGNSYTDIMDPDSPYTAIGFSSEMSSEFEGYTSNEMLEPTVSHSDFGWLSSSGMPIVNSRGENCAVMFVDINMTDIVTNTRAYAIVMGFVCLVVVFVIGSIAGGKFKNKVSEPIELLTNGVRQFGHPVSGYDKNSIISLDIKTGNEIEELYDETRRMQVSIVDYMDNLQKLTAEKQQISTELSVATSIQTDMLPKTFPAFPDRKEFDIYASMAPAKQVGGDFYDFFFVDDDHLAIVIADVSDKGVPAALFMVVTKTMIKNQAQSDFSSPAKILKHVNNSLCEGNEAGMFVTVWLAIINIKTGEGKAANAGHEHPVIKNNDGDYVMQKYKHSPVVAVMEGLSYTEHDIKFEPGDSIFVYTDGVIEATNSKGEMFGEDRVVYSLNKHKNLAPKELIEAVTEELTKFVGSTPQFDDMTMLSFKFLQYGEVLEEKDVLKNRVEREFDAEVDQLPDVVEFIMYYLDKLGYSKKDKTKTELSVEEIFVNIATYAYGPEKGKVRIILEKSKNDKGVEITFDDSGIEYNPLEKEDPDLTLSAEERKIGGLGIYLTKKSMDEVSYDRVDTHNVLKIVKYLS